MLLEKIPAIRLFKGDLARLKELYPAVSYNVIIRKLVHSHIKRVENKLKETQENESLPKPKIDL